MGGWRGAWGGGAVAAVWFIVSDDARRVVCLMEHVFGQWRRLPASAGERHGDFQNRTSVEWNRLAIVECRTVSALQLCMFPRALRPAFTVLRPHSELPCALPDLHSALPELGKKIYRTSVFLFSDELYKTLQICAHVFIDRPQNCAQILFRSRAGLRPSSGRCSRIKLCQI